MPETIDVHMHGQPLTTAALEELTRLTTPSVANAIEVFNSSEFSVDRLDALVNAYR